MRACIESVILIVRMHAGIGDARICCMGHDDAYRSVQQLQPAATYPGSSTTASIVSAPRDARYGPGGPGSLSMDRRLRAPVCLALLRSSSYWTTAVYELDAFASQSSH